MSRIVWLVLVLVCVCAVASADESDRRISQYAHTAWRTQDGIFNGSPNAIAQTNDGYLWIATDSGLLQFDGVRFVPWKPEGVEHVPTTEVRVLLAASDGSLWIGARSGLSRWKNRTLTTYSAGPLGVGAIIEDRRGQIWFSVIVPASGGGPFCQVMESGPRCFGSADGVPPIGSALGFIEDAGSNLWIGGETTLVRWSNGIPLVHSPSGLLNNAGFVGITSLAAAPDGTLWVGMARTGPGLGLQRLAQGRWSSYKTSTFDSSTLVVTALYRDRRGALWIGTDHGIVRIHGDQMDRFDRTYGLTDDYVTAIRDDREGNIWVATVQGVDRFTATPVITFSAREGLCAPEVSAVLAARDGSVWIGSSGSLTNLRNGTVTCLRAGKELPGEQITSLFEDHASRLWVGIDDGLWLYENHRFRKISRPGGKTIGLVTTITEDTDDRVWIAANGPPRILMRIDGLSVAQELEAPTMTRRAAADPTGGIWLGSLNGDLTHLQGDKLETYQFSHDAAALLHQLLPLADGSILAATTFGLIGWDHGKQLTLTTKNGLPCDGVNAITFDNSGNLWLFLDCGLSQVTRADFQIWRRNPGVALSITTLDAFDGVRTGRPGFDGAARSLDGHLWFANSVSLLMLDARRLRRNPVPPPVHIERLIADRTHYSTTGTVRLPALTRDLEIQYVGLSFTAAQKVLFRYRLEGRDTAWQEPGTRRQAFYSDLRPGVYRFRVVASNNDGVWNEEGAALDFVIAHAWYQTRSFLALCIGITAVGSWALYRARLRQVARALTVRFDERLAERTRVARELHDTLLQTVQGTKMVADDALDRPDDGTGLRSAMEQVSMWLGQAASEGRTAINTLRASTVEGNDLAAAFRRAIGDCGRLGSMDGSLSVTGNARELHPVVRDEVYRIGYEAIRNACKHSQGTHVEVRLTYSHDLTLRVADNGVGIERSTAERGKPGHFGLLSMRERAERIGAKLAIVSAANSGTEIVLVVDGGAIFNGE
jgi:signal transduction histidine kinase/ligand-binding sensor domain-containing protein